MKKERAKEKSAKSKSKAYTSDDNIKSPMLDSAASFSQDGNKRKFTSEPELREFIISYFQWCEKQSPKRPPTWAGLAIWLGTHKSTLFDYITGTYDSPEHKYSDTLKTAKSYLEDDRLVNGLTNRYNPFITKFDLANNYGYADKLDTSTKPTIDPEKTFDDPIAAARAYKILCEE